MTSVWSYEGMRVVVSGGGGAGMGAATVRELANLGAEIHVLDLKEPPIDVAGYHSVDLRDPDAIAGSVELIGGPIHALFNCAGLPGGRFSDLDTMTVNFAAMRHLTDLCVERMSEGAAIASISSGAGAGWQASMAKWMPLVTCSGWAETVKWLQDHPDRDRQRLRALQGGHHHLDHLAVVRARQAGDPNQLHQPRAPPTRR